MEVQGLEGIKNYNCLLRSFFF